MVRSQRRTALAAGAAITVLVTLAGAGARADVGGKYQSAIGGIVVEDKGGVITGKATADNPCGFKKGAVVLSGTRLDDTIQGEVTLCKQGAGCKGQVKGLAMLLITRSGSVISGYVHADTGKCKTPLGNEGISMRRGGGAAGKKTPTADKPPRTAKRSEGKSEKRPSASSKDPERGASDGSSGGRRGGRKTRTTKSDPGTQGPRPDPGSHDEPDGRNDRTGERRATAATDEPDDEATGGSDEPSGGGEGAEHRLGSLDEGEPPVSPGPEARKQAEALAIEGGKALFAGDIGVARAKFEEAVQVDPAYAEGYNGIGVSYYQADRYEEAEEHYKRALEANPAFPDAYYNLACLYALRGDKDKAFNYLRISVINGFVDFEKVDEDPDLQSLKDDERYQKFRAGTLF